MSSKMDKTTEYVLCEGVRARKEAFGLLFYNSADTKLTFVKSGDLLHVERKPEGELGLRFSHEGDHDNDRDRAKRIIETLLKKGLIVETRTTV